MMKKIKAIQNKNDNNVNNDSNLGETTIKHMKNNNNNNTMRDSFGPVSIKNCHQLNQKKSQKLKNSGEPTTVDTYQRIGMSPRVEESSRSYQKKSMMLENINQPTDNQNNHNYFHKFPKNIKIHKNANITKPQNNSLNSSSMTNSRILNELTKDYVNSNNKLHPDPKMITTRDDEESPEPTPPQIDSDNDYNSDDPYKYVGVDHHIRLQRQRNFFR